MNNPKFITLPGIGALAAEYADGKVFINLLRSDDAQQPVEIIITIPERGEQVVLNWVH